MTLQQAAFDQLQGTRDDMVAALPRIVAGCEFGPATQAGAKTCGFRCGRRGEKTHVFAFGRWRRAHGATVDAGTAHGDEEQPVETRIAAQARAFAGLLVERWRKDGGWHGRRLAPLPTANSPFSDINAERQDCAWRGI